MLYPVELRALKMVDDLGIEPSCPGGRGIYSPRQSPTLLVILLLMVAGGETGFSRQKKIKPYAGFFLMLITTERYTIKGDD